MDPVADHDVADAILAAARVLTIVAVRSLAAASSEITLPQFRALHVLSEKGALTLGALAAQLDATPSSASRLCDRLVAKDLISRTESPASRREVRLELTDRGAAVHSEVMAVRQGQVDALVASMAPHEREGLVRGLRSFVDASASDAAPSVVLRGA